MSNPIELAVPVYVNDAKIGEVMSGNFDIDAGVSMQIAQDATAIARGSVTCKMKIATIVPTAGLKSDLYSTTINQVDCEVQMFVGGRYMSFTGIISGCSTKWDVAKGTCDGDWDFMGTAPATQ